VIPLSPSLSSILLLPLAIAAFLLPGWLLNRRIRSPAPELTVFLASAVLLFLLVLGCVLIHVPLTRGPLLAGWTALCAILAWWARKAPVAGDQCQPVMRRPVGIDWMWTAIAAVGLASVVLRAVFDPLSGFDNVFRWDYLARAMLALGRLDFYPPVTAADFDIYSWCDGIPPLVPTLNFWIYLFTGSTAPVLTAVRVAAEAVLVFCAIARLAREIWGEAAGPAAMAVAATSSLLLWAVAMGQETGLTTLTLLTLLVLLAIQARTPSRSAIFWAGVAAGCGALSREYGLAFLVLGSGLLLARRDLRAAGRFGVTAAAVAAPWYLRNWMITGNPLFPHALGGLFPTNPRYQGIMQAIAAFWGYRAGHFRPVEILPVLGVVMGVVLVFGAIGAKLARRKALAGLTAFALVAGLCGWSLPLTAGGWIYGLRILAPAAAVSAALGGWIGVRLSRAWSWVAVLVMLAGAVDAARRSWLLPDFPFTAPLSYSFAEWRENSPERLRIQPDQIWPALILAARGRGIVVDHPQNHAEVTLRGGLAVPLFSPRLDPAFDTKLSFENACARLRAGGVRFFAVSANSPIAQAFNANHPFMDTLCRGYEPVATIGPLTIYDLESLNPKARAP